MFDLSMGSTIRNTGKERLMEQMTKMSESLPQPKADKDCMKRMLTDDVLTDAYLGSMKEALRTSSKGAAWEFWIFASDYGFHLRDLDGSRLAIWHGGLDVNVPVVMPKKASELIPNVKYHCFDSEGHVSLIVQHREQILLDLMHRCSI
jgi:hypothetical protein